MAAVDRRPNWTRAAPAFVYDYAAQVTRGDEVHNLGTHDDSATARAKCAEFINSKQQGVSTPCQ